MIKLQHVISGLVVGALTAAGPASADMTALTGAATLTGVDTVAWALGLIAVTVAIAVAGSRLVRRAVGAAS